MLSALEKFIFERRYHKKWRSEEPVLTWEREARLILKQSTVFANNFQEDTNSFRNTALHARWSSAAPAAQPWPRSPIDRKTKTILETVWEPQTNNKMLEYNMKITWETLLGILFALWTSKNDPTEAQRTPNASPKSPNGAQSDPRGLQNGAKREPKATPKCVKNRVPI